MFTHPSPRGSFTGRMRSPCKYSQVRFKDSDRPPGLSQPTGQAGFQKRPHPLDTPACSPRISPVPRVPKTLRWGWENKPICFLLQETS